MIRCNEWYCNMLLKLLIKLNRENAISPQKKQMTTGITRKRSRQLSQHSAFYFQAFSLNVKEASRICKYVHTKRIEHQSYKAIKLENETTSIFYNCSFLLFIATTEKQCSKKINENIL